MDYDLSFFASAPRPTIQQISTDSKDAVLHVEPRLVEAVRVRMNLAGMQTAITGILGSMALNLGIDLDVVQRDVQIIIDNARRNRAS